MDVAVLETDASKIDCAKVIAVLACAPWAASRTLPQVELMVRNTQFVVLASIAGTPVGFARAVSDNIFRAFVEDVVVVPEQRGTGLGRLMISKLEEMIGSKGVPRLELVTQKPGFWRKLGFEDREKSKYLIKWLNK
jgi:ribosomal protein S18 acetylase RimI-like enzyme